MSQWRCSFKEYPLGLGCVTSVKWWLPLCCSLTLGRHGAEGFLDNRARWLSPTNTACSKSVRTLLVEVTSLKRRYCLKLPSIFLLSLVMALPFPQRVSERLVRRPRDVWRQPPGQGWLPRGTQGGMGWSLARLLREMDLVKLWNIITVWYGVKATQIKVSYYKLKHVIIMCLKRLHIVSSFRKRTGCWQDATSCRFLNVPVLQTSMLTKSGFTNTC